jgi:hypothetical protein
MREDDRFGGAVSTRRELFFELALEALFPLLN